MSEAERRGSQEKGLAVARGHRVWPGLRPGHVKLCCGRQARETWAQEPLEQKRVVVSCPILLFHQVSGSPPGSSSEFWVTAGRRDESCDPPKPAPQDETEKAWLCAGVGVEGLFRISGVFEPCVVLGEALPPPASLLAQDSCILRLSSNFQIPHILEDSKCIVFYLTIKFSSGQSEEWGDKTLLWSL